MITLCLYGIGMFVEDVINCLKLSNCTIIAAFDKNIDKQNSSIQGISISSPEKIFEYNFDYIIIANKNYQSIITEMTRSGVNPKKIIAFWQDIDFNKNEYNEFIDMHKRDLLRYKHYFDVVIDRLDKKIGNAVFEISSCDAYKNIKYPKIISAEQTLNKIIKSKLSMSRFGDGELEIILGRERPFFQKVEESLKKRLMEILSINDNNIILCLADNYGNLDKYTEDAAYAIRKYLNSKVREEHYSIINMNKLYHDAYVTRPYIIYRDKKNSEVIFNLWKKLFENRDLLLIEGRSGRMGVGNDLLDTASSIKRILCPDNNVWTIYKRLYDYIKKNVIINNNLLVLVSLGPTATVLAYDLYNAGYQAIDIGQLDNEYEWYLAKTDKKINIPNKRVAECGDYDMKDNFINHKYQSEIMCII